jgi:putative FmdB family regulatory protein
MYEFRCKNCGHIFEEFVFSSSSSSENLECPVCKSEAPEKLMSAFSSTGSSLGGYSYGGGGSSCGGSGFS